MLSFFKNKSFLKDLIPNNHIDFHSHLLPGIDDGAATIEDTVNLISELMKIGYSQFVTTPHVMPGVWDNTKVVIESTLESTREHVLGVFPNISLHAGAEYLLDDNFVKLFKEESLLTLNDNYVLVEMSYINPPIQLYQILFDLQIAGYTPVLAHPERYNFYASNFSSYKRLRNAGCLFQLNLLSTVGYYGDVALRTAEELLKAGMIDFAGTDVHHQKHIAALSQRILIKDAASIKAALENNEVLRPLIY